METGKGKGKGKEEWERQLRRLSGLFKASEMSDRLLCPPAATLARMLGDRDDASQMLMDFIEVADAVGAKSVQITLDLRTHASQSIFQPSMAAFQGPALLLQLDGCSLTEQDVCQASACPILSLARSGTINHC